MKLNKNVFKLAIKIQMPTTVCTCEWAISSSANYSARWLKMAKKTKNI